ncbi:phage tail assembly chaperone [Erythrobacteraceae bacterium CFH 75059]|uniref:phage tail assembly chaperone n=1 Tax=Qipengyuania thermophila TaxID=2509361 RepID=UPI00101F19C8|nr:phage tail assembly chaperone [Qipengyuania thermophila]TCD06844.1 phage tail assembly chaperone [Erythrobacteraceae bacterium CFH 75059]
MSGRRFASDAAALQRAAAMLGWTPPVFWSATPAELLACLPAPDPVAAPPSRAEIELLMRSDADG